MSTGNGRRQTWVEWISVKDGLPPCAAMVLAYVPSTGQRLRAFFMPAGCAYTDEAKGYWREDAAYSHHQPRIEAEVTHWMELPAGPETQAERQGGN